MAPVIVKLILPFWLIISPHYVQVAPNHDPIPKPAIHKVVQHKAPVVHHTYNVFTDAPHTHAGLVAWSNSLPYPWPQIIRCESLRDDSWRVNSASHARGVFQFLRSTWESLGLSGDPAEASWAQQYYAALKLRIRDGIRSWECAQLTGVG